VEEIGSAKTGRRYLVGYDAGVLTDVSEEHIASIFRVEEISSAKAGRRYHLVRYNAV
jgi:hypothetical protein